MDLLLFFIKRDEIDVYDIPIARIADEYLAYVRVLEEIDLDGVGDFVYMAALLINIKARMLLPSSEDGDEGEDVDPRRELVERLLKYVRFKEAANQLDVERQDRQTHFTRGDASAVREDVEENEDVAIDNSVYDLVEALGQMLDTAAAEEEGEALHEVEPIQHSVEEQQRFVLDQIQAAHRVSFRSLVGNRSKGFMIATFLAILELTRQHYLKIEFAESSTDFFVSSREGSPFQPEGPVVQKNADRSNGAMQNGAPST